MSPLLGVRSYNYNSFLFLCQFVTKYEFVINAHCNKTSIQTNFRKEIEDSFQKFGKKSSPLLSLKMSKNF